MVLLRKIPIDAKPLNDTYLDGFWPLICRSGNFADITNICIIINKNNVIRGALIVCMNCVRGHGKKNTLEFCTKSFSNKNPMS